MQAERWRRVQDLFDQALELEAEDREAFLAEACGDDQELRDEVAGMLEVDASLSPDYFENVVVGGSALLTETFDPILQRGSIGKYKIVEKVGEGGFGMVHRGVDQDLKREVAIKTCTSSDERLRLRFQREAEISARLQHPNITTVHDLGIEDGIPYLVQELLSGEDLSDKIENQAPLDTATRLDYLLQMARGLAHAHKHGVLHRDVKPGNMRVLDNGRLKILDFGIARLVEERNPITTEGVAVGTVGYLSPEQFEGTGVDRRSDIFSFGVVAYELLTQVRPFPGSTFSEVSFKLIHEPPIPMGEHWPDCPLALEHLVSRCLEKDKQHRYQDFNELIPDLEAVIEQLAGDQPLTTFSQETERRQRNRWWVMAAGILGLLVLLIAGRFFGGRDDLSMTPVVESAELAESSSAPVPSTTLNPEVGADRGAVGIAADERVGSLDKRREPVTPTVAAESPERAAEAAQRPSAVASRAGASAAGDTAAMESSVIDATELPATVDTEPGSGVNMLAEALPQAEERFSQTPPEPSATDGDRPIPASETPTATAGAAELPPSIVANPAPQLSPQPSGARDAAPLEPATEPSVDSPEARYLRPAVEVEPELLHRGTPIYPRRAYILKLEARVQLLVRVDDQGHVTQTVVKSCTTPDMGFEAAAQKAASKSRFRAGTVDGVPAASWHELTFEFKYQ